MRLADGAELTLRHASLAPLIAFNLPDRVTAHVEMQRFAFVDLYRIFDLLLIDESATGRTVVYTAAVAGGYVSRQHERQLTVID